MQRSIQEAVDINKVLISAIKKRYFIMDEFWELKVK